MRRFACAILAGLPLVAGAVLLGAAVGSQAQPPAADLEADPPPLVAPQLLSVLDVARTPLMPPEGNPLGRASPLGGNAPGPGRSGPPGGNPPGLGRPPAPPRDRRGPCFREGPGGPCVPVCTRFVASPRCDRFPSAEDGCLRFVGRERGKCLRGAQPGRRAALRVTP